MYLSISKKINFTQMARIDRSFESHLRQKFRRTFEWISFNHSFFKPVSGNLVMRAIDPRFISKAGKKNPGIGYFWSGCASAMNGLNLSVGSINTLMHNASMQDRSISMSGGRQNLHLNHNDFKELLFYSVRDAA